MVIDLHGCTNNKLFDCSLWSDNYQTCEKSIVSIFETNLNNSEFSVDNGSEYLGGQVTRQCGLITNSFQMEIKRIIRSLNIENYYLLESFIDSMEKSIYQTYDYSLKLQKSKLK